MKKSIILGSILALALVAAFYPATTHAYGYGYDGYNYVDYSPVVYNPTAYNPVVYNPVVYQPVYYPVVYAPLRVSCYSYKTSAMIGEAVRWQATASGGNGDYTFAWSGTEGIYGQGHTIYSSYRYVGTKYASVTVYSAGQNITQSCSNTVSIFAPVYSVVQPIVQPFVQPIVSQPISTVAPVITQPIVNQPIQFGNNQFNNNRTLDIACFADPTTASVNQPVSWTAEVTGGIAPYKYSWSGSDDLSGNTSSITKWYSRSGSKYAVITITSADGATAMHACSNSVTVRAPASTATAVRRTNTSTVATQPISQNIKPESPKPVVVLNTDRTANAGFTPVNIPWGWIAGLVIFILFATVMYLLFNRTKI